MIILEINAYHTDLSAVFLRDGKLVAGALGPAHQLDTPLEPRHEAVAASLQVVFEAAAFIQVRGGHDL
jgi:hypothetical protein